MGNIQASTEYVNLLNTSERADRLIRQLTDIKQAIESNPGSDVPGSEFLPTINILISELTVATMVAQTYLDNIIVIFQSATEGASSSSAPNSIPFFLKELYTIYTDIYKIVGTFVDSTITPSPFNPVTTLPILPILTLAFYDTQIRIILNIIIGQYNNIITNYNGVVSNLNSIQDLAYTTELAISNAASSANRGLADATNILMKYFPGSTAPPLSTILFDPTSHPPLSTLPTIVPT